MRCATSPSPIFTAICYPASIPAAFCCRAAIGLTNQLVGLERRTTRAGRDSIDHAPSGHDDLANAVAGTFDVIAGRAHVPRLILADWSGNSAWVEAEVDPREWAAAARNVELGSAPSSIAKGSDIPNDFVLRRMGLAP
jgi:hypothetical protein